MLWCKIFRFRNFRVVPVFLSLHACWFFLRSHAESVHTWDIAIYLLQNKLPEQVSCVRRATAEQHAHSPAQRHKIKQNTTQTPTIHAANSPAPCAGQRGRMEDNTETRKKKEAEESKDIRLDKEISSPGAPRLHATCQIYGTQSTNFNTMVVTLISAMSVAWSTLLSEIKKKRIHVVSRQTLSANRGVTSHNTG